MSQLPKVPLNILTPIIAKIKMNKLQTMVTLVIDGKELKRALTMSFIPLFLLIILRGLKALNALRAFTDLRLSETLLAD